MNAARIAVAGRDAARRETPDAGLVAALRGGDHGAFAELYRRHYPNVARFVRSRVRDDWRAEDVAQEAFISALHRLRESDSEIAFRPWIFEIARNASIDLYRRTSRAEEVSMDTEGGLAPGDARRVVNSVGPDASVLRKETFDHLRSALDELSGTHLRIIVMRELEGRSYREIGERMELSQAAVESTLFRARRKLEHEYAQLDSGRRCRLVGAAIGRLAEGLDSRRDRLRLDRHARRCSACRRQARQLGVEPLLDRRRRGVPARAAALLPFPAFLRRHSGGEEAVTGSSLQHGTGQAGVAFGPSFEVAGSAAGKAVALLAAAAFIGGSGATLGGAGPLAVEGDTALPGKLGNTGDSRDSAPARPRSGGPVAPGAPIAPTGPKRPGTDDARAGKRNEHRGARRDAQGPADGPPGGPGVGPPSGLPPGGAPAGPGADAGSPGVSAVSVPSAQPALQPPPAPPLGVSAPAVPAVPALPTPSELAEVAGAALSTVASGSLGD